MALRALALLAFFLLLPAGLSAQPQFHSRRLSVVDGLAGNTVKAMVQDRDGYIWMGGTGGLSRYDGYAFADFTRTGIDPNAGTSRHIGLLDYDARNHLLWVTSSTYTHSLLDLVTGRYVDYTGRGDAGRSFRKYYFANPDMWLYTEGFGIRHVGCHDRRFTVTDYRAIRDVAYVAGDADGNIWSFGGSRVQRIDAGGRSVVRNLRSPVADMRVRGRQIVVLTADGRVRLFSTAFRLLGQWMAAWPGGRVPRITYSLIWQNRYLACMPDGVVQVDLRTGKSSRPADLQLREGLGQGSLPGWQFVANKYQGTLYLFPDHGAMRRLDLFPGLGANAEKGRIFNVQAGGDGMLYVAGYGGGFFVVDLKTGHVARYTSRDAHPLFWSDEIYTLMRDRSGCVWLGTAVAGVACLIPDHGPKADYVVPDPAGGNPRANYVRAVFPMKAGGVELYTMDNRRYVLDTRTLRMSPLPSPSANVYARFTDVYGREWVGTRGNGLFVGADHYSASDAVRHIPVDDVFDIVADARGRVWVATWRGGLLWAQNARSGVLKFHQLLTASFNQSRIHDLELMPDGRLFVATYDGLYSIDTRQKTISAKQVRAYNLDNGQLPGNEIYCLHAARNGHLWVGCLGWGVLDCSFSPDYARLHDRAVTRDNGLATNNVTSMVEDRQGRLWLGTEEGLSVVDGHHYAQSFQLSPSLPGNVYSENCGLLLPDGRLLFGTRHGVVVVSGGAGIVAGTPWTPLLTDIKVGGVSVLQSDEGAGSLPADGRPTLRLRAGDDNLELSFSNFDYRNADVTLYQYYLEGAEDGWREPANSNCATYNTLSPGTYRFHLRAVNGRRVSRERVWSIVIPHPWYASWWAVAVYVLLAGGLGWWAVRRWKVRQRVNRQADLILHEYHPERLREQCVALLMADGRRTRRLMRHWSPYFHLCRHASVGELMACAPQEKPALVVCDARLLGEERMGAVKEMKATKVLQHVPVMMLAPRDDEASQLTAYENGVDDYMAASSNSHLLLARAVQLVTWGRARAEASAAGLAQAEEAVAQADVAVQPAVQEERAEIEGTEFRSVQDKRFKERLDYLIAQNLSAPNLTVDFLADKVRMGHTRFYGRVKEVTGMPPNRYLMQERMRVAAQMLLEGEANISEVAFSVGFQDQSYFSKCFKKAYGVTPSKYGKKD